MLRSDWSPITCGFLTWGPGRAFLPQPFQSFCTLSSCYQHQQWLACQSEALSTAQPVRVKCYLHGAAWEGETLRLITERLSELPVGPLTEPLLPVPSPGPTAVSSPSWCVWDMAWPLSPEGPRQEQRPELLTPCRLCTFMTQSQDLDISPDVWSPLAYARISWNA